MRWLIFGKSIDGGARWQAFSNGLTNSAIWTLAIDQKTPAMLFAGTNGGVFFLQREVKSQVYLPVVELGLYYMLEKRGFPILERVDPQFSWILWRRRRKPLGLDHTCLEKGFNNCISDFQAPTLCRKFCS
jgi:hypothetical protein